MPKRFDVAVTPPGIFQTSYYAVARSSETGQKAGEAYGKDRREAVQKVVQRIRASYPDAQILY